MGTEEMLAWVLLYFDQHYPRDAPEDLCVRLKSGRKVRLSFPPTLEPQRQDTDYQMSSCKIDIIEFLETATKPVKQELVNSGLAKNGKKHGPSTVNHALAELVKDGVVSKVSGGYKLPEEEQK